MYQVNEVDCNQVSKITLSNLFLPYFFPCQKTFFPFYPLSLTLSPLPLFRIHLHKISFFASATMNIHTPSLFSLIPSCSNPQLCFNSVDITIYLAQSGAQTLPSSLLFTLNPPSQVFPYSLRLRLRLRGRRRLCPNCVRIPNLSAIPQLEHTAIWHLLARHRHPNPLKGQLNRRLHLRQLPLKSAERRGAAAHHRLPSALLRWPNP